MPVRLFASRLIAARRSITLVACLALIAVLASPTIARADDDGGFSWDHSFSIKSDLRFRLEDKTVGAWYGSQRLVKGVEREQNTLGAKLSAKLDKFRAVAAVDLVLFGYQEQLKGIGALSKVDEVQPYYFDVKELYVEADSFILKGLDLRIGQQIVQWGVADQFNPTNNLNSDDLRDTLLFGKQNGNFMVRADYYVTDDLSWSAVLVPLFRPALLPTTAPLQLLAIDRLPFLDKKLRWRIASESAAAESKILEHPTVVGDTTFDMPTPNFENMQASFRMAWTMAQQDFALSYYNGRTDFPVPVAEHTRLEEKNIGCSPVEPQRCGQGFLKTDVTLEYPRMQVWGLNIAGELPKFSEDIPGLGYRFEGALISPQQVRMTITQDALPLAIPQAAGEYDYDNDGVPGGKRPLVLDDQPFFKWTLGIDYTFGEHVYANVMWVHGLADEFGAGDWMFPGESVRLTDVTVSREQAALQCALPRNGEKCEHEVTRQRIGDYLVLGVDLHFLDDAALVRIFTLLDLSGYADTSFDPFQQKRVRTYHPFVTPEGFSGAVYPEFDYNFGNGFQVGGGALFLLGKDYTKFGDPAGGGSLAFMKASYAL